MLIGLTGRIASGKTEVAEFLKKHGFQYVTISQVIREEAGIRNIEITRRNLQDLGNEVRKKEGGEIWIQKLLKRINLDGNYIIDGIRNTAEVDALRKIKGFVLISVDSPQKKRYERVLSRNKESDPKNWEGFLEIDNRDFGEETAFGQQVGKCMGLADFCLFNDSTLANFNKDIEEIYDKIKCS